MHRRAYLFGIAGTATLLTGCSGRNDTESALEDTVTPAPVPEATSDVLVADSAVNPSPVGDAHVSVLSGGNARIAYEYEAASDGRPHELTRLVATVDGPAATYRRYDVRPLEQGGVSRLFNGFWYDSGDAVIRLIEAGHPSVYREEEEFTPPPAADKFARDSLVATLAGFAPSAEARTGSYRLTAEDVAAPARLPSGATVDPGSEGKLTGRLERTGLVSTLVASASGSTDGDPLRLSYRFEVTDRGETTVERPHETETYDWYLALQEESPIETPGPESDPERSPPSDSIRRRRRRRTDR